MKRDDDVRAIIERVGDLPALPSIVSEVLRLTEDATSSTSDVCEVILGDPAMTAKVLRVSNSPYYGMKQFVGTLKLALVILGVREVRNIVLGIAVFETLGDKGGDAKAALDIWNRSLRVGGLAKKLGRELGLGLQGEEFISGLLTDIGKMSLLRQCNNPYQGLLKAFKDHPAALCKAEQQQFGFTHADVSMALANEWNLPQTLGDALWCQYETEKCSLREAKDPALAAVVRVAKLAEFDDFTKKDGIKCLEDAEAWDILSTAKNPIVEERRRELIEGYSQELKAAGAITF